MEKSIQVHIPEQKAYSYEVRIGKNIIEDLKEIVASSKPSSVFLITDQILNDLWGQRLKSVLPDAQFILVQSGEENKDASTLQNIWQKLKDCNADRSSLIINFGGGVIGDMGGFAAACYMRGLDFIQVPTSLLAQVDASVGGKLAIDFAGVKNLVGLFQQPSMVLIDLTVLSTLPKEQFISGFAEILKHGLIYDKQYWRTVTSKVPLKFSTDELIDIVNGSVIIKSKVVALDEKESGKRKILNFGHTAGHAFESLSLEDTKSKALLHGEAIALGMLVEAEISKSIGWLAEKDLAEIQAAISHAGLPTSISADWSIESIMNKILLDKKNRAGEVNWSLLKAIGEATFDIRVEEELVREAIFKVIS